MELMKVLSYEANGELVGAFHNPHRIIRLYITFMAGSLKFEDEYCLEGNEGLVFFLDRLETNQHNIFKVRAVCFSTGDKGVDLKKLIGAKVWKKR